MFDQINMFENSALISGTNFLNELHWENGLKILRTAQPVQEEDQTFLLKAIESGIFWKDRLKEYKLSRNDKSGWSEFLVDFQEFKCADRLKPMKKTFCGTW